MKNVKKVVVSLCAAASLFTAFNLAQAVSNEISVQKTSTDLDANSNSDRGAVKDASDMIAVVNGSDATISLVSASGDPNLELLCRRKPWKCGGSKINLSITDNQPNTTILTNDKVAVAETDDLLRNIANADTSGSKTQLVVLRQNGAASTDEPLRFDVSSIKYDKTTHTINLTATSQQALEKLRAQGNLGNLGSVTAYFDVPNKDGAVSKGLKTLYWHGGPWIVPHLSKKAGATTEQNTKGAKSAAPLRLSLAD